jgi:hypothetical protein
MNMRVLEQDWDTDVYEGGELDWSGFAAEQALTSGRRFGLYEESNTNAADSHLGFVIDSLGLEDDPE